MDSAHHRRLSGALYYGPIPALTIDVSGKIIDYNIAMETLLGARMNGRRYRPLAELLEDLAGSVVAGSLPDPTEEPHFSGRCALQTEDFGRVDLDVSVVECRDLSAVGCTARLLFWQSCPAEGDDNFHGRFRENLDHQLDWESYAWSYDRILLLMPYYQEVIARHFSALVAVDGPLLDLGAGTGNLVERLIGAGRRVVAIDNSRAMLDKLRSKPRLVAELGRSLTIIEANAEHLPLLENASFAGVSILLALFDMEAPEAALAEAIRTLRAGGTLVVTELKECFQIDPILEECRGHLLHLGRYDELAKDMERVIHSNHKLARTTRGELRAERVHNVLVRHGFRDVLLTDSHFGLCATVRGKKSR